MTDTPRDDLPPAPVDETDVPLTDVVDDETDDVDEGEAP